MLEIIGTALGIFILRVIGNMLTTLRLVMNSRGKLRSAFFIAIAESLIFAYALGVVVIHLNSYPNLIAYALGFAVGGYLAMRLEQHLMPYFVEATIFSTVHSHELAEAIRKLGLGATEIDAHGGRGDITIIKSIFERRQLKGYLGVVHEIDPDAFVTVEGLRATEHGILSSNIGLRRFS